MYIKCFNKSRNIQVALSFDSNKILQMYVRSEESGQKARVLNRLSRSAALWAALRRRAEISADLTPKRTAEQGIRKRGSVERKEGNKAGEGGRKFALEMHCGFLVVGGADGVKLTNKLNLFPVAPKLKVKNARNAQL